MIKKIISYIFTFILILLIIATTAITIFNHTILKKSFLTNMLIKSNYYNEIYSQMKEHFINNTVQTGLDEEVLDDIITEEEVKSDIDSLVSYMYGEKNELSTSEETLKDRLKANIDKQIAKNNKKVTSEEQNAINRYIDTISNIYNEGIVYADKYVKEIANIIQKIQLVLKKVIPAGFIAIGVIVIVLLIMNKMLVLKYLSVSLMASGILFIVLKILETTSMQIHNILVLSVAFSNALIAIVETILSYMLITGIALLVIGFIVNIISSKIQEND